MQYAVRGVGAFCVLVTASVVVLCVCTAAAREPSAENVLFASLLAVLGGLATWAANDISRDGVYCIPSPPRDESDPEAGLEDDPERTDERVRVRVSRHGRFHLLQAEMSDGQGGWKSQTPASTRAYRPSLRLVSDHSSCEGRSADRESM